MQTFSDTLGQVFRAIMANKLRSFLTMFGIAWGVGSLLVLVGLPSRRWPISTPGCGLTSSPSATKPRSALFRSCVR
jgi:hypothetical protein